MWEAWGNTTEQILGLPVRLESVERLQREVKITIGKEEGCSGKELSACNLYRNAGGG
jgi:hypothetical protein